jgi:glutathione S-transferase
MKTAQLSLYEFEACPFCQRVLAAMRRLGLDIELRDIRVQPKYREELLAATGRATVPCLRIEEGPGKLRWMHESADIIKFLEQQQFSS